MMQYTGPIFKPAADGAPGYVLLCKDVPAAYWAVHNSAWKLGPIDDLEYYLDNFNVVGPPERYTSGAGYQPARLYGVNQKGAEEYANTTLFWIPAEYVMPELNEYGLISL